MRKITMATPSKQAYVNATNYIMPMPLLATLLLVDDATQSQLPAPPLFNSVQPH